MIKVYQIDLTDLDCANAWDDPRFVLQQKLAVGLTKFDSSMLEFFQLVACVDTDSMNRAFQAMNRWNDDDLDIVQCMHVEMQSMSVGNILEMENGDTFIVQRVGFEKIENELEMAA